MKEFKEFKERRPGARIHELRGPVPGRCRIFHIPKPYS
jgi:hypothetical protein